MAFWVDRGVAGFRVDMAYSLVKGDPDRAATCALWRALSDQLRETYPDAVLLPESDIEAPVDLGLRSGFDGDFFLVNQAAHSALFNNGGAGTLPWLPDHDVCFFDADGPDGPGSLGRFLTLWNEHIAGNGPDRRVVLATADHDFSRLHVGDRGLEQLPAAYTFLLTWGTVPSIYYGDEIGMRYLPGLPDLRAASATRATTAPAAARRCNGTTPFRTPGSPTPSPTCSTCRRTQTRTARPSPPSSSTRGRCSTPSAAYSLYAQRTPPSASAPTSRCSATTTHSPTRAVAPTWLW